MDKLLQSKIIKIILLIVVLILIGLISFFSFTSKKTDVPDKNGVSVWTKSGGVKVDKEKEDGENLGEELDKASAQEDKGDQVILMPKDEVFSFIMTDTHGIQLNFEKRDEKWVYLDNESFEINQDRIDKVLNYLCDVRALDFIVEADGEYFGLNQDSKSYRISDATGDTIIISIGNADKNTGKVYFAINYDFSTVYVNSGKLDNVSKYGIEELLQR